MTMKFWTLLFFLLIAFSSNAQTYPQANELQGLQVGDTVKSFEAVTQDSSLFHLDSALGKGYVVVMFYRGQWCPVCNKHMKRVQDSLHLISDAGATLVAISPEKPEYLAKAADKTGATFTLLYDSAYQIGEQFDVVFKPSGKDRMMYNTLLGAKLDESHSDDSERLPIPATFILNQEGVIVWRHFNPNYKIRASVSEILRHLPKPLGD
ncbi:MAG: peroxiredoxin family protein [Bacteroidetes bacterium]|nr:MAG: peroxiredoxin family protein [Bacteroidota bacterium]